MTYEAEITRKALATLYVHETGACPRTAEPEDLEMFGLVPVKRFEEIRDWLTDAQMEKSVASKRVLDLQADMLAIAHATGIYHEADGHNDAPGPVSEIVEEIDRLRAIEDKYNSRYAKVSQDSSQRVLVLKQPWQTVVDAQTVTLYEGPAEDMPERLEWPEPIRDNGTDGDERDAATITRLVSRLAAVEADRDDSNRRIAELEHDLNDKRKIIRIACEETRMLREERDAIVERVCAAVRVVGGTLVVGDMHFVGFGYVTDKHAECIRDEIRKAAKG